LINGGIRIAAQYNYYQVSTPAICLYMLKLEEVCRPNVINEPKTCEVKFGELSIEALAPKCFCDEFRARVKYSCAPNLNFCTKCVWTRSEF